MLRITCFSDVHNDVAAAKRIAREVSNHAVGVMMSAGDPHRTR